MCVCVWACVRDDGGDGGGDGDDIDHENNVVKYTTKWAKCLTIFKIFDKIEV